MDRRVISVLMATLLLVVACDTGDETPQLTIRSKVVVEGEHRVLACRFLGKCKSFVLDEVVWRTLDTGDLITPRLLQDAPLQEPNE